MKVVHADHQNQDFLALLTELDLFLNDAIGGFEKREKFVSFNKPDTLDAVVLLYDDSGNCAGCGAFRRYDSDSAEVKRLFVREKFRGHHYSELILEELAHMAKQENFKKLILETGDFLGASVRIYQNLGFYVIPNYPPYEDMSESLCMECRIDTEPRIRYKSTKDFETEELVALFQSVNWMSANYPKKLTMALNHSQTVYSTWDGKQLVGLVNAIDDSAMTAYMHYLLVHPDYQGIGIGKTLLSHMKYHYRDYICVLISAETKDVIPFYQTCGFAVNMVTPMKI